MYLRLSVYVESTFEIEIVLVTKIEQLTKQKLYPSRKLNLAQVAQMKTQIYS